VTDGARRNGVIRDEHGEVTRRGFLQRGGSAAAVGALLGAGSFEEVRAQNGSVRTPPGAHGGRGSAKNVIFLVADGMSAGTLMLGDLYSRAVKGKGSVWVDWLSRAPGTGPRAPIARAMLDTSEWHGGVTDSAAAATAWSVGEKTVNGAINVTPDGRAPEPLWMRAKRAGKRIGVVSTARITHATPAGYVANIHKRDMELEIAEQMVARGVDVMLGGGKRFFPAELVAKRGGVVVGDLQELRRVDPWGALKGGLLGAFTDSHMSFEIERDLPPGSGREPSLAEMTRAALSVLEGAEDGFALHVEGGRVDHAAHYNDAGAIVREMLAFEEALEVCLEWASHDARGDETLIIATTDHGNANPGLSEYGEEGLAKFRTLVGYRRSLYWCLREFRRGSVRTGAALAGLMREATGEELGVEEVVYLDRWVRGEAVDIETHRNMNMGPMGAILANRNGVGFVGPNHTGDLVECTAQGPGSEGLWGARQLTDLERVVAEGMGLPERREERYEVEEGARLGTEPD